MHRTIISASILTALLFSMLVLSGCGDNQAETPAPTVTALGRPILKVYGPLGSKATLETLGAVFESSGIPFELRLFEGVLIAPGIQGVLDGTFDLMFLSRRPLPDEPLGFKEFVYTPIAFFVNPDVGVDNLTRDQLAAIYSGDVTNWSELGGVDQEIVLLFQEEDDTTTEVVRAEIMQGQAFADPTRSLLSDNEVLTVVDGLPGAIGYAGWAGKKYAEFISSADYPDAVTYEGNYPDDPAYSLVSVIGVAYRPDREDFLQPLFDWGDRFVSSAMVRLLIEQFGLRLAPEALATQP